jgi:hypothetical protein
MAKATERKMRSVTANFFQFQTIGDTIAGVYIHRDVAVFHRAGVATEVGKYTFEDDETGERRTFLGGTVIDQTMETVPLGSYVEVEYVGDRKTSNNMNVKQFDIRIADEG